VWLVGISACATKPSAVAVRTAPVEATASDPRLDRVIANYVGLWRRETLDEWEKLFLPSFTVANTRSDGSINLRTREEFFAAQRGYHARVDNLKEELERVSIDRQGRMASVWADFVVTENANRNRGRLVLLLMEDRGNYKIHSLMFSYDK
jgi:hypothetical protein